MRKMTAWLAGAMLAVSAGSVAASPVTIDFEGVGGVHPIDFGTYILDYYSGGTSSIGTSGINYGISFDSNAEVFCLNTEGVACSNASRGGLGAGSETAAMGLVTDGFTSIEVAGGFTDEFSFVYSQPYVEVGDLAAVYIYDGAYGSGNLLASMQLGLTPWLECDSVYGNAEWCPFVSANLGFEGTAHSVVIAGTSAYAAFDDLTFGKAAGGNGGEVVNGIPEPASWALMIAGFGLVGLMHRRRRSIAA